MKSTGWHKMTANDVLIGGGAVGTHCLSDPGKEYTVYRSGAGSVTLNIAGAAGSLSARWLNLVTNEGSPVPHQSNGIRTFTNPWTAPAVLHLLAR